MPEPVVTPPCWECEGLQGDVIPANGLYIVTSFGCWLRSDGTHMGDAEDNCRPGAYWDAVDSHLCDATMTYRECEEHIVYFTAGMARYPSMTRLRLTNIENGKSVIAVVFDNGPACWVENLVNAPVMDISVPVSLYLFGSSKGWSEKDWVHVEVVSSDAPLGPTEVVAEPPEPPVEIHQGQAYRMIDSVRNAVNVRAKPAAWSDRLTVLYKSADPIYIVEIREGWGRLETGGWVWMEYLEKG